MIRNLLLMGKREENEQRLTQKEIMLPKRWCREMAFKVAFWINSCETRLHLSRVLSLQMIQWHSCPISNAVWEVSAELRYNIDTRSKSGERAPRWKGHSSQGLIQQEGCCCCLQIVRKEDNEQERLEKKMNISPLAMMSLW